MMTEATTVSCCRCPGSARNSAVFEPEPGLRSRLSAAVVRGPARHRALLIKLCFVSDFFFMIGSARHGRYRRGTGPPAILGSPRCIVQDRGRRRFCRLECVAGCGIIGVQRTNSAHLHRPWRANHTHSLRQAAKHLASRPTETSVEECESTCAPSSRGRCDTADRRTGLVRGDGANGDDGLTGGGWHHVSLD
jgi:hypothetical protein